MSYSPWGCKESVTAEQLSTAQQMNHMSYFLVGGWHGQILRCQCGSRGRGIGWRWTAK